MLGTTGKGTYFTELKAGGRFAIYAFGIHLAATFTIGCLGLIIGSPLLTFPLAMLISNPIVWILMGVALAVTYKLAIEPLFYWVKGYVSGKGADQDKDSGVGSEFGSEYSSRRSSNDSLDSGLGGEFHENLQTLVHQTNRENYTYWLNDDDIKHIARVVYRYSQSEHSNNNVYFLAPVYSNGWDEITRQFLQNYKDKLKQNPRLILTSVFHINNNHWVTLVVKPDADNKKFRAYYCNSFGNQLPNNLLDIVKEELQKEEWVLDVKSSGAKQQSDGYNCGIFALENARMITQMLKEDKSFDQIDTKLSEYKPDSKQLEEKRREFAEALINDKKWREDLEKGLLCDLSPRTATSQPSTSKVQEPGRTPVCNTI